MPPPGADRCIPNYWAEPGDEDPVAFCAQGNRIYVVTSGTVCGVFFQRINGVSNAHWRAVKSWAKAIQVWNESCDVYHETRCPHQSRKPAPPPRQRAQFPANDFVTSAPSRSPPARPARMHAVATAMPARSTPHSPVSSASLQSPSTPKSLPAHKCLGCLCHPPLAMMDAVDAFSRMGVADPSAQTCPPKQWVIGGVKKFFAQRIDAIDHILTLATLASALIMGSRNIHKLRAFTKGVEYVRKPGHAWDSDEE
ncbi:hypothetical protein DFH08DRAFT_979729 [Mycena albidolilacea]|uniref:Uncharacterized protein n=1 Tax=Mycena albidolilacea TaxID=1033008 RepID=A0AAD7E6U8_9AGAR|nr:hypothetical protein DFH08DRAFT_979729 [Mycena albidolilacea]